MVTATYTEADFDNLSWHDCHVHGIELLSGDRGQNDWTSAVALDIDFIAQWICGTGDATRFRVAPATLTFHAVTDLRIEIDWATNGYPAFMYTASLDRVEREPVVDQKVSIGRPYYSWTLRFNWPERGVIRCGAAGFTLNLRSEPIEVATQELSRNQRRA